MDQTHWASTSMVELTIHDLCMWLAPNSSEHEQRLDGAKSHRAQIACDCFFFCPRILLQSRTFTQLQSSRALKLLPFTPQKLSTAKDLRPTTKTLTAPIMQGAIVAIETHGANGCPMQPCRPGRQDGSSQRLAITRGLSRAVGLSASMNECYEFDSMPS